MTSILRTHLMHACMPSPALHSGPRLTWAVKMLFECTALLNLELRGVWTLASAHALCLTTSYLCLSISGAFWGLQGFTEMSEVVWEFGSKSRTEHSPDRGECRG